MNSIQSAVTTQMKIGNAELVGTKTPQGEALVAAMNRGISSLNKLPSSHQMQLPDLLQKLAESFGAKPNAPAAG